MTNQEERIIKQLANYDNVYGAIAKLCLKGNVTAQETIFAAIEQSYYPNSIWGDTLIDEIKVYARLHGKEDSWLTTEEYNNYIIKFITQLT